MSVGKDQEKVNAEWDAEASQWDEKASGYAKVIHGEVWNRTGISPSQSNSSLCVLDFGCGTGLLTSQLREHPAVEKVVALDAAPKMVQQVAAKIDEHKWGDVVAVCAVLGAGLDALQDPAAKQELTPGRFSLITASSVFCFVPDLPSTLTTLAQLLTPGGLLFHSDWYADGIGADKYGDGFNASSAAELYKQAGLEAVTSAKIAMPMGDTTVDVFIGVARRPLATK